MEYKSKLHLIGGGQNKKLKKIIAGTLAIAMVFTLIPQLISNAAETWNYGYTGGEQTFTAPYSGRYRLELYGASGGTSSVMASGDNGTARAISGGQGGTTIVEVILAAGQTLYINAGGAGGAGTGGGYNGGGNSSNGSGSGGGATSVAYKSGLLQNVTNASDVLAVAGGGGGTGSQYNYLTRGAVVGSNPIRYEDLPYRVPMASDPGEGGGDTGQDSYTSLYATGEVQSWIDDKYGVYADTWLLANNGYNGWVVNGGTQNSGYTKGRGQDGQSGSGGAGAGWYGGRTTASNWASGAGGSGYANPSCTSRDLRQGGNTGNGRVAITYLGTAQATINVDLGQYGTRNGQSKFTVTATYGQPYTLSGISTNSGYSISYFKDIITGKTYNGFTFTVDELSLNLKAYGQAKLQISASNNSSGKVRIQLTEDDEIPKKYKIYQWRSDLGWQYINFETAINENPGALETYRGAAAGYQYHTVGYDAFYRIEAASAKGGNSVDRGEWFYGGSGGIFTGYIALNKGEQLTLALGVNGGNAHSTTNANYNPNEDYPGNHGWPYSGTGNIDRSDGNQVDGGNGGYTQVSSNQRGELVKIEGGTAPKATQHANNGQAGRLLSKSNQFIQTSFTTGAGSSYFRLYNLGEVFVYNDYFDNMYIDDYAAPNAPSNGQTLSGNAQYINLTWNDNGDNGTQYKYYAESYNRNTGAYLSTSDTLNYDYKSGVAGYYYYIDGNPSGTVTKNHTYVSTNAATIPTPGARQYMHIATVDRAGNLSGTYSFEIIVFYTVRYDKNDTAYNINGNPTDSKATGYMADTSVIIGNPMQLAKNAYSKVGYTFSHWNTKSDGTGKSFSDMQTITFDDLGSLNTTLYAIWKPIEYDIVLKGNGSWDGKEDIRIHTEYDKPVTLPKTPYSRPSGGYTTPDGYTIKEPFEMIGWGRTPNQTTPDYGDGSTIKNLTTTPGEVPLYALWHKRVVMTFDLTGGRYKNQAGPLTIYYDLYNSQLYYDFPLTGNSTSSIDGYGKYDADGLNDSYMKHNESTYERFVGWTDVKGDTPLRNEKLQDNIVDLVVYDDATRNSSIRIYDNQTLYAVWEKPLYVREEIQRTLGNIDYQDGKTHKLSTGDITASMTADSPARLNTIVRPGEQGTYKLFITNSTEDTSVQIKFDSSITDIYDNGDSSSQWYDNLNPISNNPLDEDQKHGLDRAYFGESSYISNKWYTPNYFGTDKSFETSIGKESYTFTVLVSQPSLFYEYTKGTNEEVAIVSRIDVTTYPDNSGGSGDGGDSGHGPGGDDTTLDELRTRLKIRLLD